ncbi:RNA polymerase sigma-54 factor [Sphingobium indicum]|uniref:RNA polymerase sigma-54 factor n=2 Tax=Sphingobium indicum TaxID=332055 RepID=A0A1L5BTA4_SPHIB|nr:RNA polymerase factor sigma-54 [Sphingobium indicum]APL96108.1 RNA polymerase sigma-54 factor [Sphingobium indicum B90A]KEY99547.1 RNA polymerase sigma54 factor [Sphingomonas sp. BHC-A]NYI24122.1 RNA polymerase sigma-54 factor [Sphingobium indicum]RYL99164.1 RNA polymerase sigma-54 factor [Sphingobium indicum]
MTLAPRLDLRQSQSLVMTPQLQQAIKLLALSNLEIEAFVAGELEKNPLLEAGGTDDFAPPADGVDRAAEQHDLRAETGDADQLIGQGLGAADSPLDVDYGAETFIDDGPGDRMAGAIGSGGGMDMLSGGSGEAPDFDSFANPEQGLQEHLMDQARSALSGMDLMIAAQLIGQIDEAGYLEVNLLETAHGMGVPLYRIEQVLGVIHGFDPTGVGARSLSECLALQAKEADRYDPCMAKLLANLDLLARGALPQLRRICGVDEEDMADMIRELRGYDPKPGLRFSTESAAPVTPDLFVRPTREGWAIEVNSATLPRVLINRTYYVELASGPQDRTSKAWLADCLASANWLVKALDQRQKTIVKVASEIVRQQEDFFRKGVEHLKPLTLKAVADAIQMHESTVSRVTSNKYLSCPRGLYELKYFFTSGVSAAGGEGAVSAEAVKSHIKALIAAETADAILSDDTLVDLLRAKGMDIARRTVAKYREAMGIGSSVQRRRQKALRGQAA